MKPDGAKKKIRGKQAKPALEGQNVQTDSLASKAPKSVQKPVKRAYSRDPDAQYLTVAEIESIFRVIKTPRDRAAYRLIYHRGLRSSELGLLQLSDWQERDGLLFVRRKKNSFSRAYRLLPIEAAALRAWIKLRGRAPGPLFPSRQIRAGGLGIHRNQLDRLFRNYCERAGLRPEKWHMHVLKHSCGTHLSERGNSADVIQDWMGHKSSRSTEFYLHFSPRRRQAAFEKNRDWR